MNSRYKWFRQTLYTAGDHEQFFQNRNKVPNKVPNKTQGNTRVTNTFNYIFEMLKKGIFAQYMHGKLTFLPFSNANFQNNWSEYIRVNYQSINNFLQEIHIKMGYDFNPRKVKPIHNWYANNMILRYDFHEGESGVLTLHDMFSHIQINKFCEFFINKRDFPLLRKDGNLPYTKLYGMQPIPKKYPKNFSPILSMVEHNDYQDIAIPTWADWEQASKNEKFEIPWNTKKSQVIFRGASTGPAIDNPRITVCKLEFPWLDAGITKWNFRPRIDQTKSPFLQTIDPMDIVLKPFISRQDQSKCKFILNIDGHVCAYRLSVELNMGCVIFLVESEYRLWYYKYLKATNIDTGELGHYIPIKSDFSNLELVYKWCIEHDAECQMIVQNAKVFYAEYLTKEKIIENLEKIILENCICNYSYKSDPFQKQLLNESRQLAKLVKSYPQDKCKKDKIICQRRNYKIVSWCMQGNFPSNMVLIKKNISRSTFKGIQVLCKKTNIHEAFIGLKYINNISIPNFMYTFGYNKGIMYAEYINGYTLFDYISSKEYNIQGFINILLQVCLALQTVQDVYQFVHYDLYPWNIVLKPYTKQINYKNISIKPKLIPVIIDYGRSQVNEYGYAAPPLEELRFSPFQDILTFMVSSFASILTTKYKSKKWFEIRRDTKIYLDLANLISKTEYTNNKAFNSITELKRFCKYEKNLSLLVTRPVDPILDKITPIQFFNQITSTVPHTLEFKWQTNTVDLRRNSMAIFKKLCNVSYDPCARFLKKSLPNREHQLVYDTCMATLGEYRDNPLYEKCMEKLHKLKFSI